VAAFLGKVSVLTGVAAGNGRYRVGDAELTLPADGFAAGAPVRIYLRPEDRHIEGDLHELPNRLRGTVRRIEYLGTVCLAEVHCGPLGQSMLVSISLNQLHDLRVREGADLDFALRTERVRVFPDAAAQ
jgi:iron(III) transport system ATP-binding protein